MFRLTFANRHLCSFTFLELHRYLRLLIYRGTLRDRNRTRYRQSLADHVHRRCVEVFQCKSPTSGIGNEVATAESMADGLRLAKGEPFDLHIPDSRLPGRRGTELCTKIREFDRATPIIFYSGETP